MKGTIKRILTLTLALTLVVGGIVFYPKKASAAEFITTQTCSPFFWKKAYNEDSGAIDKGAWTNISGAHQTIYIHENQTKFIFIDKFDQPKFGDFNGPDKTQSRVSFSKTESQFSDNNVQIVKGSDPQGARNTRLYSPYGWQWLEFNQTVKNRRVLLAPYETEDRPMYKYISTKTGGYYFDVYNEQIAVAIKGTKAHQNNGSSTLYIYKNMGNVTWIFKSIKIVVIRPTPTQNNINVNTSLDGVEKSAVEKITLYPYKERDNEENAKVYINLDVKAGDSDIFQVGDSFSYSLIGSDTQYLKLEPPEDDDGTGQCVLYTKEESTNWSMLKGIKLRIQYNTWDSSFEYYGPEILFNESAGISGYNPSPDIKKHTVIKEVPVEIKDKAEIKGVPFFITGLNGRDGEKEEVKDGNLFISNRLAYPRSGELLTVGDGYTIDSIELTDEAKTIMNYKVYTEDYYSPGSEHIPNPTPLYYKGDVNLYPLYGSGKGTAYGGIIVNIKKNGSISSYRFNAMVVNDCYKLLDSEININKDSAVVHKINNLKGYTKIQSLISDNKDYTDVIFNPNEATYTGYDNGIIEVKSDGTIIPRTLGSTTVTVKLPAQDVIGSIYQGKRIDLWSVKGYDEVENISYYKNYPNVTVVEPKDSSYKKGQEVNREEFEAVCQQLYNEGKSIPISQRRYFVSNDKLGWFLCKNSKGEYYKEYKGDLDRSNYVDKIDLTCKIKVNVNKYAAEINIEDENNANDSYKLTVGSKKNYSDFVTVLDKNGNYENVSRKFNWFSDIPRIATVDENGTVTAKAIGLANITVKTTDGSELENSFSVKVVTKPPQNIKTYNTKEGIKLTWNSDNEVESYNIYKSEDENGEYKKIDSVEGTTYIDKGVEFGKKYFYKLTTTPKDDTSLESLFSSKIKHSFEVATPTLESVTKEGSRAKVKISGEKYSGWVLYYGTSKNPTTAQAMLTSKTTEISLPKHGTYYFRVKAYATQDDKNYYSNYSNQIKFDYSSNTTTSTTLTGTVIPTIKKTQITIKIGKKKLKITNSVAKKIKFKSSNKKVLTISKTGKIKYKKKGKATVTFTYNKKKYKIKFTIKKKGKKKFKVTAKFKKRKFKFTVKRK